MLDPIDIAWMQYEIEDYQTGFLPFVPTPDQSFFGGKTINELITETSSEINILTGSNANEGFFSLMYADKKSFPNKELTIDERKMTKKEYFYAVNALLGLYPAKVCLG